MLKILVAGLLVVVFLVVALTLFDAVVTKIIDLLSGTKR